MSVFLVEIEMFAAKYININPSLIHPRLIE